MNHIDIWDEFCNQYNVVNQSVPLFKTKQNLAVDTSIIGTKNKRKILSRNSLMEDMVIRETDILINDIKAEDEQYDGLIYIMFFIEKCKVIPLYIGKTESKGRINKVSANIDNIRKNKSNFARWGNNYQYHIGDLSAVVLPGHPEKEIKGKYKSWANSLFVKFPSEEPRLKEQVFFWCKAWNRNDVGIWREFGKTRLTFLEYLMIGVASSAFPKKLLNREGQNRS